jgi:hypothetical protein
MRCLPSVCPLRSRGDANCDQLVDNADLSQIINKVNNIPLCLNCSADFNTDNKTDLLDYEIWRATVYK